MWYIRFTSWYTMVQHDRMIELLELSILINTLNSRPESIITGSKLHVYKALLMKQIRETAKEVRKTRDIDTTPVLATKPFLSKSATSLSSTGGNEELLVIQDDDSDSDNIIAKSKFKRTETAAIEKFELEKCTTLLFISLTGVRTEVELKKRVSTYSDLQREIARLTPKREKNKMFVIQNSEGML